MKPKLLAAKFVKVRSMPPVSLSFDPLLTEIDGMSVSNWPRYRRDLIGEYLKDFSWQFIAAPLVDVKRTRPV